jgi:hypothetical protein
MLRNRTTVFTSQLIMHLTVSVGVAIGLAAGLAAVSLSAHAKLV